MRKRMKKYFLLIQNFRIRLQNLFRSQIRKPQSTFQNYNIQKVIVHMNRMAAAPLDTMKNTRSRRPDHVRVIGADVCEAPNSQRAPRKGIFCHPRAIFAIRTYNLPSKPSKQPKSPQNAIFWQ